MHYANEELHSEVDTNHRKCVNDALACTRIALYTCTWITMHARVHALTYTWVTIFTWICIHMHTNHHTYESCIHMYIIISTYTKDALRCTRFTLLTWRRYSNVHESLYTMIHAKEALTCTWTFPLSLTVAHRSRTRRMQSTCTWIFVLPSLTQTPDEAERRVCRHMQENLSVATHKQLCCYECMRESFYSQSRSEIQREECS